MSVTDGILTNVQSEERMRESNMAANYVSYTPLTPSDIKQYVHPIFLTPYI